MCDEDRNAAGPEDGGESESVMRDVVQRAAEAARDVGGGRHLRHRGRLSRIAGGRGGLVLELEAEWELRVFLEAADERADEFGGGERSVSRGSFCDSWCTSSATCCSCTTTRSSLQRSEITSGTANADMYESSCNFEFVLRST